MIPSFTWTLTQYPQRRLPVHLQGKYISPRLPVPLLPILVRPFLLADIFSYQV